MRQCIEPSGLPITEAAASLGVVRPTLSKLVNEKRGMSPEMAVRLPKVFGGTAERWLVQQAQSELSQVRAERLKLERLRLKPASPSLSWPGSPHAFPVSRWCKV